LSLVALAGCGDATRLEVVVDHCLDDPAKVYPGVCGCGVPEQRCVHLKETLVHRYAFSGRGAVAADDVGLADGVIVGTELTGSGQVDFDRAAGVEQYVSLPNGIISVLGNATFESWVIWSTPPTTPRPFWERIFDFGTSTLGEDQRDVGKSYLFLGPSQDSMAPRFPRTAFQDAATDGEIRVNSSEQMPTDRLTQVAVVVDQDAQELRLYIDAVEEGRGTLTEPLSAIEDVNNWLARSQFKADTQFGGSFHEFRIYAAALSEQDLADSLSLGPSPGFLDPAALREAQDASRAP
jgi:hypothetical protein